MLARAVIAARVISGVGLGDEVWVPYLPRVPEAGSFQRPLLSGLVDFEVSASAGYFRAYSGSLALDQPGDSGGAESADLNEIRSSAEWLLSGNYWQRCPYENTGCDDVIIGPGTFEGPQSAFLVRRLDPGVDVVGSTETNSAVFFNNMGRTGGVLERLLTFEASGVSGRRPLSPFSETRTLSDLTEYFERGRRVGGDSGHGCFTRAGCSCDERTLACIRGNPDDDVRSTFDGNAAFIGGTGLTVDDVLNGMELVCAAARIDSDDADLNCDAPPDELSSLANMLQAESFLNCQADALSESAAATVVTGMPDTVVEALRTAGPTIVGGESGDIAAAIARLRTALLSLREARSAMADQLQGIAAAVRVLRSEIAISDINREIEELGLLSEILGQASACASSLIQTDFTRPTSYIGASVVCGNAIAQSVLATMVSQLRGQVDTARLEIVFGQFDDRVNGLMTNLRTTALGVRTQVSEIDAALAEISGARTQARRALARALFLEADGTEAHRTASSVYRNRYNTTLVRYNRARVRAVRSAFIARRAVEQRIAMSLEAMTDDLPTVQAPYRWADTLCRIPALDYGSLGLPTDLSRETGPEGPTGYADTFIGEYVDRLEEVVNSYSFAFPFHEGTDAVVVSLRDDIFGTRAECEVTVPNLLLQTERLHVLPTDTSPGWDPRGCICPAAGEACGGSTPDCCDAGCVDLQTDVMNCGYCGQRCGAGATCTDGVCRCLGPIETCSFSNVPEPAAAHCASIRPLDEGESPPASLPPGAGSDYGIATGFEVAFGGSEAATEETRIAQDVMLDSGVYRVSWYGRSGELDAAYAVGVVGESGVSLLGSSPVGVPVGAWTRYHNLFRVVDAQTVEVRIQPNWETVESDAAARLQIGGLMLENVTGSVSGDFGRLVVDPSTGMRRPLVEVFQPGAYFGTRDDRTRVLAQCADVDGATFRTQWTYGCTRVCPDGYDRECSDLVAGTRCYYQTSFPLDSTQIESLLTSTPTGFASGNYNYRVDGLAVNIVGVGVRECDGTSGCYASANLSYSMSHIGDYLVVNARGETYAAPLFPGRIESARALLAERYLTNPISPADEALIGPYRRLEFAGRPLSGTVLLRLWDEPSLAFERIEDVQIVLNYRYWTHQR
jgi:hypothetical protein